MKKILSAIMAFAGITACSDQPKVLVLYYSQYGATKTVAEELASQLGADIEAFDVELPYDGDFDATVQRCLAERTDGTLPECRPLSVDPAKYDIIFLGFPVWFGVAARPVFSLLDAYDLNGKNIVPFCTFGSGGLESSTVDLQERLPNACLRDGYGVRNARIAKCPEEISRFLIVSGFKEGSVETLPEFSEQQPLDETASAIFNQACGDYPMPLGTPVSVGSRTIPTGTEYLFTTESQTHDGNATKALIHVNAEDGAAPEFTNVIR